VPVPVAGWQPLSQRLLSRGLAAPGPGPGARKTPPELEFNFTGNLS
jgi:hypothetical protein